MPYADHQSRFITGAVAGIVRQTALTFAKNGCTVGAYDIAPLAAGKCTCGFRPERRAEISQWAPAAPARTGTSAPVVWPRIGHTSVRKAVTRRDLQDVFLHVRAGVTM